MRKFFTPPEVAKDLKVHPEKVRAWIKSRELLAVNIAASRTGRPRWRIAEADLADFLARRSAPAPAPKARRRRRKGPTITEYF